MFGSNDWWKPLTEEIGLQFFLLATFMSNQGSNALAELLFIDHRHENSIEFSLG